MTQKTEFSSASLVGNRMDAAVRIYLCKPGFCRSGQGDEHHKCNELHRNSQRNNGNVQETQLQS